MSRGINGEESRDPDSRMGLEVFPRRTQLQFYFLSPTFHQPSPGLYIPKAISCSLHLIFLVPNPDLERRRWGYKCCQDVLNVRIKESLPAEKLLCAAA